jgi:hypothetical protein
MSAREELIRSVYALKNMSQNDMEKLVDAYAHDLAEEIRNSEMPGKVSGFYGAELNAYLEGSDDAASLIDPEVSDG